MNEPESPAPARVSAAQALLDRGWGKAAQPIEGNADAPLQVVMRTVYEAAKE